MNLAEKISKLRKKAGLSQEELAERLDVSRQAVSKWEIGESRPDIEKILALSELFLVSTDYLLKDGECDDEWQGKDTAREIRKVSLAEIEKYLADKWKASYLIALGVFLCIISVFPLLILGAASERSGFPLSETAAGVIGLFSMLFIVAAAVALFMLAEFRTSTLEALLKEPFEIERAACDYADGQKRKFSPVYLRMNIIGTFTCILSPTPLFCSAFVVDDFHAVLLLTLTMLIVGIGTVAFTVAGVRWSSINKLLKKGK